MSRFRCFRLVPSDHWCFNPLRGSATLPCPIHYTHDTCFLLLLLLDGGAAFSNDPIGTYAEKQWMVDVRLLWWSKACCSSSSSGLESVSFVQIGRVVLSVSATHRNPHVDIVDELLVLYPPSCCSVDYFLNIYLHVWRRISIFCSSGCKWCQVNKYFC